MTAYDYWQNQPGNYLDAGQPDGAGETLLAQGRVVH